MLTCALTLQVLTDRIRIGFMLATQLEQQSVHRLSLYTLGRFDIRIDDSQGTRLTSAKARALLIYLAVEGERSHRRESLAELLWPESPGRDSRNNLRYTLYELRKGIQDQDAAPPFLLIDRDTVQFNPESSTWLDYAAVKRNISLSDCRASVLQASPEKVPLMEAAVARYTGPFLDGFSIDSAEFQDWTHAHREEAARLVMAGSRCLAAYHQADARYAKAEEYLRWSLVLEPWNEDVHRDLMRLLAQTGRRTGALSHFRTVEEILRRELDLAPSPETRALHEEIRDARLTIDPVLSQRPHEVVTLAKTTLHAAHYDPSVHSGRKGTNGTNGTKSGFVGRSGELAQLHAALDYSLAGHGRICFVKGAPGMGKTRLAHQFTDQAMERSPDLVAAAGVSTVYCGHRAPLLPLYEVIQALVSGSNAHSVTADVQQKRKLQVVAPRLRDMVAQVAPDLAAIYDVDPGEQSPNGKAFTSPADQRDLFQQITVALIAIAHHHPLVIVLDDLHWADSSTLAFLMYLRHRIREHRILIVGLYRSGWSTVDDGTKEPCPGTDHTLAMVVNEICFRSNQVEIDLDRSDGRALVDALLDQSANDFDVEFRKLIYEWTGGNPLFAAELCRDLRERGVIVRSSAGRWVARTVVEISQLPPRIESLIALRLARLTDKERLLLEVASVQGVVFTAEVIAWVAGVPLNEAVRILSSSLSKREQFVSLRGVFTYDADVVTDYQFTSVLLQRYLYDGLDDAERTHWHRTITDAMEALTGASRRRLPGRF